MNLLAFLKPRPSHTAERELIAARSENIFLRAKAEAGAILSAELAGRCMALEEEVRRASRPQRETRKDSAAIIEAREATTNRLRRANSRSMENGRGRG